MPYERVKRFSQSLGVYRLSRFIYINIFDRDKLRWFREEFDFYSQLIGQGDLTFDVGANNGLKSEIFLRLGAKVIAFEPQLDCLQELRARLGDNPNLVTINTAVGRRRGVATFYVNSARTASSFVKDWQGEAESTIQVSMTTLDDAITAYGVPMFCKIDVEGFELEVLKGLSRPIPLLSYEYHLRNDGAAKALEGLDHLSRLGELLVNITPAEKLRFALPQWMSKGDFIGFFREEVPSKSGFWYGDIFVKMREPASTSS